MKNVSTLLFDLDGTLSDSKDGITKSIAHTLKELGQEPLPLKALAVYVGPPLRLTFKELLKCEDAALIERAITIYRRRYVAEGKGVTENRLYPNIPEMLGKLGNRGLQLFVATSKAKDIADKVLHHFGLNAAFKGIYAPDPDGTRSDKGELITHLLSCEKLDPKTTVMVGDRKHDILGANKNGLRSIGACWGYGSKEELTEAGATALADAPETLLDLI